jgi:hypothetical protein
LTRMAPPRSARSPTATGDRSQIPRAPPSKRRAPCARTIGVQGQVQHKPDHFSHAGHLRGGGAVKGGGGGQTITLLFVEYSQISSLSAHSHHVRKIAPTFATILAAQHNYSSGRRPFQSRANLHSPRQRCPKPSCSSIGTNAVGVGVRRAAPHHHGLDVHRRGGFGGQHRSLH